MFEFAQSFEQAAMRFSPVVLVVPGLILIIAGLFLWLGGLGLSRLFIATLGAVAGFVIGLFIVGRNFITALVLAAMGAGLALVLKRIFITLLLGAAAALVLFFVLTSDYSDISGYSHPFTMSSSRETESVVRSLRALTDFSSAFTSSMKTASSRMPVYSWAFIAGGFVVGLVVCFLLWRIGSALCCSVIGTLCIFAGMILLLIFKGSYPITAMGSRPVFYTIVFGGMVTFGTIEQVLLYKKGKSSKKEAKTYKKERKGEEAEQPKKFGDWRTS